jgi:chemotaxis protein methyltransferase CheR
MEEHEIEGLEVTLLLTALQQRYGYDFLEYTRATVRRRVRRFMEKKGFTRVGDLTTAVLRSEPLAHEMIADFSITVTEMFRDPTFYTAVRTHIIPYLRTYPFIRIWHAGCATGEEVYSLAILLEEAGLYDRTTIFATDFNDHALQTARDAIYPLADIQRYTANYQLAGGTNSFGDYYHAHYRSGRIDKRLQRHITFANHNLVTDDVFSEMHLIFCRNVLIYFNRQLQSRVFSLLDRSLVRDGFLCLGMKESLEFAPMRRAYEAVDGRHRIYRKRQEWAG